MQNKLILIRHAETTAVPNTLVGRNDLPLCDAGITAATNLHKQISLEPGDVQFFCSELTRARQTAEILFPAHDFSIDPRLNEVNFGNWSGLNMSEIVRDFPQEIESWSNEPLSFSFPGGESIPDFISRIEDFLRDILNAPSGNVVLVCHGGVIRFMLCYMLKLDYQHQLAFNILKPSINIIDHDGKFGVLSGLNLTELKLT